jgi:hypothetical protein
MKQLLIAGSFFNLVFAIYHLFFSWFLLAVPPSMQSRRSGSFKPVAN